MSVEHITDSTGPEFICKCGYLMSPRQPGNGWDEQYYVLRGSFLRKRTTGRLLSKLNGEVEYVLTGSIVRDIPETRDAFEVVLQANRNRHGITSLKFACQFEVEKCAWVKALHLAAARSMAPPEHLVDIAQRMLKNITCTDRQHHFRVYKQCFKGSEAIAWIVKEETGGNYKEACDLATQLSDCGLVYHVTHKRDLCYGFHLFRFAAYVGDSSVERNVSAVDVTSNGSNGSNGMTEEESESTDSKSEASSSNTDTLDLVDSLDITCAALETSCLSMEQRTKSIESDLSRILISLAFIHILLILLGVWLLLSNSFERWSFVMFLMLCFTFTLEFFACRVPRLLSVSEPDTRKAEVMSSSISPSSQLDVFRQHALEEKSDGKGRKIETQMGLSPIENRLSVGGSKSELLMKGMSVSSILSESHDNVLAFLPPLSKWEQWPVLFRISPTGTSNISRQDCTDPFSPIRINGNGVTVPFETPLFRGHVIIRMAGLPNAEDYFHGRKRLTDFVVQGQFRRPVSFNRLMTGQKFVNKLKSVHRGLAKVMAGFIKRIQPSVEIDLLSENPFWLSPVVITAQALQVEQEGKETDITGDIKENTILLGSNFSTPMSSLGRKKYFSRPENLEGYSFQPGVVWTFDFYQHYFDAVKNRVNTKLKLFAPHAYIGQQPINLMAVDTETGEMACR